MKENSIWVFFIGFSFGVCCIVAMMLFIPTHTTLYKRGQIDALNGKVMFELKLQEDGTTQWVRK